MKTLTFTHRFESGRVMTTTVKRTRGHAPNIDLTPKGAGLTQDEHAEFCVWQADLAERLIEMLTIAELVGLGAKAQ